MNPNPRRQCMMNPRSRAPPIQELNQNITKKMASRALNNLLEVSHQRNKDQNLPPWKLFLDRHTVQLTGVTVLVWRWTKSIYNKINTSDL